MVMSGAKNCIKTRAKKSERRGRIVGKNMMYKSHKYHLNSFDWLVFNPHLVAHLLVKRKLSSVGSIACG